MARSATVHTDQKSGFWASKPGYKSILLLIAAILFVGVIMLPPPQSMIDPTSRNHPPGYRLGRNCSTITDTINKKLHPHAFEAAKTEAEADQGEKEPLLTDRQAAQPAKTMLAIFFLAVFYGPLRPFPWASPIFWRRSCSTASASYP